MKNSKLTIKESWIMDFIRDPVLAAYAIMGAELDAFQAARLRFYWFTPNTIDDSGVSTGKTELIFIWANLRAMLLPLPSPLPPRTVCVYYQSLHTARETFWPKFEKYMEMSPIYAAQLEKRRGKYGRETDGLLEMPFANGSRVELPAGDFLNDSDSQASRRFNDLAVDEVKKIDNKSKGLDKQILDRATAPCFNSNHPIHCNNVVLLGHAGDPLTCKSYQRRNKPFKRLITDGSQEHSIITSSFRDFRGEYAKKYRPDKTIRTRKISLPPNEFDQQWEGIWTSGSKGWFSKAHYDACRIGFLPLLQRSHDKAHYVLGWDSAPGLSNKSDTNAGTVYEIRPYDGTNPNPHPIKERLFVEKGELFIIRQVYSVVMKNLNVDQLSGFIHMLHQRFQFSHITLDPGGGGAWVYKKLTSNQQLIGGKTQKVLGLCTLEDSAAHPNASPIVSFFSRGDHALKTIWEPRYMPGDEGIKEQIHREFKLAIETNSIQFPPEAKAFSDKQLQALSHQQLQALTDMNTGIAQLSNIAQKTDTDGNAFTNNRGFYIFVKKGKTDGAMSNIYAFTSAKYVIADLTINIEDPNEELVH